MKRLVKIERKYEEILHSAASDEEKDRQLAELMAEMEQVYGVPIFFDAAWARKHRTMAAMYRKTLMSRSFFEELWGLSKEKLREEWRRALKTKEKKTSFCACGSSTQLICKDYIERWTVVHNTPVYKCPDCKEELVDSSVAILIEGIALLTKVPEIDFREIGEIVEALPEHLLQPSV